MASDQQPVILCLAGWAQKPDSLKLIFPNLPQKFSIIHFDYSRFCSVDEFFSALKNLRINPQIIIGWSLGGQLACRLIAEKIFYPQLLVLLAVPFQFVKSSRIAAAMPKNSFDSFRNNFINDSLEHLKRFSLLMMLNSSTRAKELEENLQIDEQNHPGLVFWLDELERFSCYDLDFNSFPRSLIIHGQGDVIINVLQAKIFAEKIPNSRLEILLNCGHCPQISNLEQLQELIYQELSIIS